MDESRWSETEIFNILQWLSECGVELSLRDDIDPRTGIAWPVGPKGS